MTVQELIEKLQEIEDKSKHCFIDDDGGLYEIQSVYDWEAIVEIR